MMVSAKTHQEVFVDEVLSGLFHAQPESCSFYLQRDGTRFLRFYWDKAGEKFPLEQRTDPFGLNYFVRQPKPFVTIFLITLPKPEAHGEAYFVAMIHRPKRKLLLTSDTTGFYALETVHPEEKSGQTQLVEWSRRKERFRLQSGIEPGLEPFYQAVYAELGE